MGQQVTTCISGSFALYTSSVTSLVLAPPRILQFSQESSSPLFPAVTACHMLYCSSPSWEASDCSGEPPRSAERSSPGARVGSPSWSGDGGAGLPFTRQHFGGCVAFVVTCCHICFLKSHTPRPGFVLGSSRLWPCVYTNAGRNLRCPPSPGTARMLPGDGTCQPGNAETFSTGHEGGSKG